MRRSAGIRWAATALATLGAAVSAGPAFAASETITTTTSCCAFSKPVFTIDPGTTASFQNLDPGLAPHDVVANDSGTNGKPLFASSTINLGTTPVTGTENLNPGTYRFFCTIHPTQMTGDLVVSGTAPSVTAKVLTRSLNSVVSSGKIKVQLTSTGPAKNVSVTATRGKAKLGSKGGIALAAGTPLTAVVKLNKAAKNSLKDVKSAKVKIAVAVPGGTPVNLKQTLK